MATNAPGGSHLAQLAARRRRLDASRQQLRLGSSGGASDVRPQAGVRAPAPTPEAPAAGPEPVESTTSQQARQQTNPNRDQMRAQAEDFLNRARASQNSSGGPTGEIAPEPGTLASPPPSVPAPLSAQLAQVGAQSLSPLSQFMRLAGRPPSGRELYIFNAARNLEQQLGRPPTRNEVLLHVTSPSQATSGPEPVA